MGGGGSWLGVLWSASLSLDFFVMFQSVRIMTCDCHFLISFVFLKVSLRGWVNCKAGMRLGELQGRYEVG
jgi:hypothetical protein